MKITIPTIRVPSVNLNELRNTFIDNTCAVLSKAKSPAPTTGEIAKNIIDDPTISNTDKAEAVVQLLAMENARA